MPIKKLSLINFKNLSQQQIEFDRGINCIVGDNGTCKTNIIDAVYYLSMCKSAIGMSDSQCVRHGESFFVIDGSYYSDDNRHEQIVCSYNRGSQKIIKRNGKAVERFSDHIGFVPVVIVSPADSMLISDSAEERRKYINSFISQFDQQYLSAMIRYNTALAERNKYLKIGSDEQMLQIYDMQLSEHGQTVYEQRRDIIEKMKPLVALYYKVLSDDKEQIEITYRSELEQMPLGELLLRSRERDIINQFTTVGIHRDDVTFKIGGYPLRKYGSQGQQKSFLIALKLAQYRLLAEAAGEKPILLLDDLFDKLDMQRVERLLGLVAGEDFGQICITDCNKVRLEDILSRAGTMYNLYSVEGGDVVL
jgi:DNA replication and repair protein RecF